ncbi:MAG: sugar phosphate isomerase/epimerase [Actinobacteria bacterium]|nr:sugar phosphate isomerase/epimerase [Actinomycetota bacterium]
MANSWHNVLNLGIVTHVLAFPEDSGDGREVLEIVNLIASDPFFDAIEIAEIKEGKIKQGVKEIIQISHLEVVFGAGHTTFAENLDLNSFDKDVQKKAINRIKGLIDMAYFFGARTFAITSGTDVADNQREGAKKILVDSLREICEYAKKQEKGRKESLILALESFDREFTHRLLIGPTSEAVEVVSKVRKDYDNIGVMVDLGHLPLLGESMRDAISQAGLYLKHVHIGNCVLKNRNDPRFGDTHPYFGYPGGENNVEQVSLFLKLLEENNYFSLIGSSKDKRVPTLSVEIIRRQKEDIRLLIANVKRVFNKAWATAFYS